MGQRETILDFIQSSGEKIYCDDCLSKILQIFPRQTINMICRKLVAENKLNRLKNECKMCTKIKILNKIAAVET